MKFHLPHNAQSKKGVAALLIVMAPGILGYARLGDGTQAQGVVRDATGSISGVVISDKKIPIRGAILTLSDRDRKLSYVSTLSDDGGRFEFTGLPAARYDLRGAKPGFLSIAYGALKPDRSGLLIVLAPGQSMDGFTVALVSSSAVSGRVLGSDSQGVSNVEVVAFRSTTLGSRAVPFRSAIADDRGQYRIWGLEPGNYFVAAIPARTLGSAIAQPVDVDSVLRRLETLYGSGGPILSRPPVSRADASRAEREASPSTFAPIFYPGGTDFSSAVAIVVTPGDTQDRIDLAMVPTAAVAISGMVIDSTGRLATGLPIRISTRGGLALPPPLASWFPGSGTTDSGGRFRVSLAPGQYAFTAVRTADTGTVFDSEFASEDVVVGVGPQPDVNLTLRKGIQIAGRVKYDGGSNAAAVPDAEILLYRDNGAPTEIIRRTKVDGDGSFIFHAVVAGQYRAVVQLKGPEAGRWYLEDGPSLEGTTGDQVLDVRDNLTGLTIKLASGAGELSGSVKAAAGVHLAGLVGVVFPVEPERRWKHSGQILQLSTTGLFEVAGLAPGRYYLAFAPDLVVEDLADPVIVRQLSERALTVLIKRASRTVQDFYVR